MEVMINKTQNALCACVVPLKTYKFSLTCNFESSFSCILFDTKSEQSSKFHLIKLSKS